MASPRVFKIIPTTQQYDWGKIGRDAKVAQFAEASQVPGFTVQERKPYAELWMGTHPSSPSKVRDTGEILSEHLARHQDLIGPSIITKFPDAKSGNLPFLFKVLSIAKALSIQSHPDKATAEQLHAESPHIYKDPNHKPEMALAITQFEALCGFRPLHEIAQNLHDTPELASLIPAPTLSLFYTSPDKSTLKDVFSAVMHSKPPCVRAAIDSITARYRRGDSQDADLAKLIIRLQSQFPYDIGILCPFLLNYLHLAPGDAIFLGAGEPHAYLSGEAIECMANSDNVIRAGLTPKLRDVPNLVAGLTYRSGEASEQTVPPADFGEGKQSELYDPPIEEFSVAWVRVLRQGVVKHREIDGPSIALVAEGAGRIVWSDDESLSVGLGDVVFIGANTPVSFEGHGLSLYRAFVEV